MRAAQGFQEDESDLVAGEEIGALPRRQHGEIAPRAHQEVHPAVQ